MLTFFTVPKPFQGHIGIIQRNAIRSWTLLRPDCEVILFGDDEGVAEAAAELGVRHRSRVARNDRGTPLLDDIFAGAARLAGNDLLGFVNTDIVLMRDFAAAVAAAAALRPKFLLVGRRTNLELAAGLDFAPGWERRLRDEAASRGALDSAWAIDYFVFPRGMFPQVPAFAVGRAAYDNWLLFEARRGGAPIVDATRRVLAIHQAHDYSHIPDWPQGWVDPESEANRALAGGPVHLFSLDDATHHLADGGIRRRPLAPRQWRRWLEVQGMTSRIWSRPLRLVLRAVDATHPLRARVGLAANPGARTGGDRAA